MKQQSTKSNKSSAVITIFSVILFLLILVVFGIQLSIIITYFIFMNYGRCVYTVKDDSESTCYCDYTTKAQCDAINGVYNNQLNCSDGFATDCIKLPDTSPPP